ncbi:uncharacterized protein EV420DRAFT_606727 [Desarmillaria tabescens]|uniref:Uncharacterized protein n=1 Tax=Armillaria tabescens TaxID=1929756 RepID=A0AA39K455_ARMTA|nr:uncharacterized protein EV420DRAFT_606727 [Desarmillaria tabescens]KAK0454252.1 hypothetical protein EV420DRAFT_606727 [Desarmillaria tabescens]
MQRLLCLFSSFSDAPTPYLSAFRMDPVFYFDPRGLPGTRSSRLICGGAAPYSVTVSYLQPFFQIAQFQLGRKQRHISGSLLLVVGSGNSSVKPKANLVFDSIAFDLRCDERVNLATIRLATNLILLRRAKMAQIVHGIGGSTSFHSKRIPRLHS